MEKKTYDPNEDPTLSFTEIELDGKVYKLCFTYRVFRVAAARLSAQGVAVNLLWELPNLTMENLPAVLAAALGTFHPEITYEAAEALIDWDTVPTICEKIVTAWIGAMPKRERSAQGNPAEAVAEQ